MELEKGNLKTLLEDAAAHHHEYEANVLGGAFDEAWADWYGAFLVGKVEHLRTPSVVTQALQWAADMHERDPNRAMPWSDFYAEYMHDYFQQHPNDNDPEAGNE